MHLDDCAQPCADLRVVDITQGMTGPMATMILADYGARVIKVEPPGGDWARHHLRGFHMWNRGKESIVLDLAGQRDELSRLLRWADVVVTDARPAIAARFGLDRASIEADNPAIVHCHVGTWAGAGDDDLPVFEAQLSAATGQMTGLDVLSGQIVHPTRADPTFTLPPTGSYGAAMLVVQGILAALVARERSNDGSGRRRSGEYLETSLLQGAMTFLMRQGLARPVPRATEPEDDLIHRGIELCFLTAECADGRFVQMCARQDHHFRMWLRALGIESVLDEPRFARAPMGINSLADVDALEQMLRERMRTRTQAEWMRLFTTEYDLGADPFLTPQEFLDHPQMVDNGRVATLADPVLGRVTELGMLVEIDGSTRTEFDPAPILDQHGADIRASLIDRSPDDDVSIEGRDPEPWDLPLAGVTILEVAYFVAGPLATTLLAEMGARVIKVEPLDGDPYRRTGLQSTKFLTGKESIALDLKRPGARAVLHELIRRSDAMVHSFRAGVPERLGMDERTARSLRPDIVYLNAASYGSRGPESGRIAFHSTPTALSGAGIAQAGRGNSPVDDSFPDPAAGLGAATALMLGLFSRQRTGTGVALETTMLSSAGYVMSNDSVMADGRVDAFIADHDQLGLSPHYRLYECADGWIFVAAVTADHAAGLREATGVAGPDDESPADHLAARFREDTAESWLDVLRRHGVPASPTSADSFDLWLERHGMLTAAEHDDFPPFYQMKRKVEFVDRPPVVRSVCSVGEHTRDILVELGYDDAAIAALVDDGAVAGVQAVRT